MDEITQTLEGWCLDSRKRTEPSEADGVNAAGFVRFVGGCLQRRPVEY